MYLQEFAISPRTWLIFGSAFSYVSGEPPTSPLRNNTQLRYYWSEIDKMRSIFSQIGFVVVVFETRNARATQKRLSSKVGQVFSLNCVVASHWWRKHFLSRLNHNANIWSGLPEIRWITKRVWQRDKFASRAWQSCSTNLDKNYTCPYLYKLFFWKMVNFEWRNEIKTHARCIIIIISHVAVDL